MIIENNLRSVQEIMKYLNVSDFCVFQHLKKYNVEGLINRNVSHYEDEITDWLKSFNIEVINNKRILNKKEIDIFLPEYNIGIEFNGTYWHSDIYRDKNYHQQKTLEAKKEGIFLYHIFEFEWKRNEEKIKNHLINLLSLNEHKLYARKCVVKEIFDNKIKKDFLNLNHLQGNDNSNIKLGLYYNDVLVEIMTFCKPRFNRNYQYELSRLCSLKGYNIVGGASKLFHYFIQTYHPVSIISYSNFSKNKGNIYNKLGFKLKNISSPNYFWIKGDIILTRYQTQKHKLLLHNFIGNNEDDIMRKNGFIKIYDCGNMVFEYVNI